MAFSTAAGSTPAFGCAEISNSVGSNAKSRTAAHRQRELILVDEALVHPGTLAGEQDGLEHLQRVVVRVRRRGHVIADLENRQLRELAHHDPPLAQLLRLRRLHGRRRRVRGDGLDVLLRQRHDLVEGDVAGDHHRGVRRGVAHPEVVLEVVERPGLDVRHPADDRPLVRVGRVGRGPELLVEHARVVRVHAVAPLGRDDAALGFDDLGIERQVLDPIGLEVEDAARAPSAGTSPGTP